MGVIEGLLPIADMLLVVVVCKWNIILCSSVMMCPRDCYTINLIHQTHVEKKNISIKAYPRSTIYWLNHLLELHKCASENVVPVFFLRNGSGRTTYLRNYIQRGQARIAIGLYSSFIYKLRTRVISPSLLYSCCLFYDPIIIKCAFNQVELVCNVKST